MPLLMTTSSVMGNKPRVAWAYNNIFYYCYKKIIGFGVSTKNLILTTKKVSLLKICS